MIYLSSRYADSEVTYILNPRTRTSTASVLRDIPALTTDVSYRKTYLWRDGDRLDDVAQRVLGDASEWWRILDANPDVLNPLAIKPGTFLVVPE